MLLNTNGQEAEDTAKMGEPGEAIPHRSFRSDTVQEIISRRPGFVERWALISFLFILLFLFAGSWFIRYPDVINVNATITTINTPKEIVIRQDGKLTNLFVANDDNVTQGQMIGWVESTANSKEVLALSGLLDSGVELLSKNKTEMIAALFSMEFQNLGELQPYYQQFFDALQQFDDYSRSGVYYKRKKGPAELQHSVSRQKNIFQQALQTLRSATEGWKSKHIITAPVDGRIIFTTPLQVNQFMRAGETIGMVSPPGDKYFAQAVLPQNNLGKIDTGQKVQLRLTAYPYQEFGFVEGRLIYISEASHDSGFLANIELPKGLITNYNKEIQFRRGLKAEALIITQDSRLLQRFYHNMTR